MVLNVYNLFKHDSSYTKVIGNDYMILEYKCPIDADKFQVLLEMNFITYIISGKKDWIAGNKTYHVKEGDAIFVRKGVYTINQYFEVDHCVLVFFVHDDFIRNFIRENNTLRFSSDENVIDDQIFPLQVDDTLQTLFYSIYTYLKKGTDIPKNLVEIKFKELLFNIILNQKHQRLSQFFSSLLQTPKSTLDDVMLKNFQYDLGMEDFARMTGRSLSAFKRDFKASYQQTPGKWLNDKRLEYASALLLTSDMNVNEVCFESGFKNSSHFNKAFKEKYHLPPNQFRIRHQSHKTQHSAIAS